MFYEPLTPSVLTNTAETSPYSDVHTTTGTLGGLEFEIRLQRSQNEDGSVTEMISFDGGPWSAAFELDSDSHVLKWSFANKPDVSGLSELCQSSLGSDTDPKLGKLLKSVRAYVKQNEMSIQGKWLEGIKACYEVDMKRDYDHSSHYTTRFVKLKATLYEAYPSELTLDTKQCEALVFAVITVGYEGSARDFPWKEVVDHVLGSAATEAPRNEVEAEVPS
jgi:hypothetical protein